MKNNQDSQALHQMRKSLLSLHRARSAAISSGNVGLARELKKCIEIVSRQIRSLNIRKNDK